MGGTIFSCILVVSDSSSPTAEISGRPSDRRISARFCKIESSGCHCRSDASPSIVSSEFIFIVRFTRTAACIVFCARAHSDLFSFESAADGRGGEFSVLLSLSLPIRGSNIFSSVRPTPRDRGVRASLALLMAGTKPGAELPSVRSLDGTEISRDLSRSTIM